MTHAEARAILNAVRECQDVERDSITAALRVTGDMAERETDSEHILRPIGTWENDISGRPMRFADVFDGLIPMPPGEEWPDPEPIIRRLVPVASNEQGTT